VRSVYQDIHHQVPLKLDCCRLRRFLENEAHFSLILAMISKQNNPQNTQKSVVCFEGIDSIGSAEDLNMGVKCMAFCRVSLVISGCHTLDAERKALVHTLLCCAITRFSIFEFFDFCSFQVLKSFLTNPWAWIWITKTHCKNSGYKGNIVTRIKDISQP